MSAARNRYTALIGSPKTYGRAPGVAYEYSNLGYTLLGRVIQNAAGCNSASATLEYISAAIIQPLGMKDTAWTDDDLDKNRLATGCESRLCQHRLLSLSCHAFCSQPVDKEAHSAEQMSASTASGRLTALRSRSPVHSLHSAVFTQPSRT